MIEKIYLIPNTNPTEYLRTMARFGNNTMGVRILTAPQLAEFALLRSGNPVSKTVISFDEQVAIIATLKADIDYFASSSYTDAGNIASSLNNIRSLVASDEKEALTKVLSQGEFTEKNRALLSLYNSYISYCEKNNLTDSIGLVRKAIEHKEDISAVFRNAEIYASSENLSALEIELVESITKNPQAVPAIKRENKKDSVTDFYSAYGEINEVENILSLILENNKPVDSCVIAVTDASKYSQLFYDECSSLGIPVTFGCGVPVSNSKVSGFLKLLYNWDTIGFNGIDALRELIYSDTFDTSKANDILGENHAKWDDIISVAGNLRLCTNAEINKERIEKYRCSLEKSTDRHSKKTIFALECAEKLFREFEQGYSHIIKTFAAISSDPSKPVGRIDRSALQVITSAIDSYFEFCDSGDIGEIIPALLNRTVCSEMSKEGALHITDINGASYSLRENLFIAGLSASKFPGKPTENYLLLDSDFELCTGDGFNELCYNRYPTSDRIISNKIQKLTDLFNLAENCFCNIYVSYSDFNFAELKSDEPSSALYGLFRLSSGLDGENAVKECNEELQKNNAGFFILKNGKDNEIGLARLNNIPVIPDEHNLEEYNMPALPAPELYLVPSAAHTFMECPRQFYFEKILKLESEDEHDPFIVIDAASMGNLLHSAMEFKGAGEITEVEMNNLVDNLLNDYLLSRPPLHPSNVKAARYELMNLVKNAFETDKDESVVLAEEKLEYSHNDSGITTGGYPDRIAYNSKTDSYTVVDFKSGKSVNQETDNFSSCVQALLYAYIYYKKTGRNIKGIEYRYPRYKLTVSHKFNEQTAKDIEEYVFNLLSESLKSAVFKANYDSKENRCRYCEYKEICQPGGEL